LDNQIPIGSRILEVGCGTGQLINLLSFSNITAAGIEMWHIFGF